jgi:hypothetical protein
VALGSSLIILCDGWRSDPLLTLGAENPQSARQVNSASWEGDVGETGGRGPHSYLALVTLPCTHRVELDQIFLFFKRSNNSELLK